MGLAWVAYRIEFPKKVQDFKLKYESGGDDESQPQ